ncbi:MAG: hypothetical protein ACI9W4_000676 [Rhodothermales bacterium]|jgi:hypothetical protein
MAQFSRKVKPLLKEEWGVDVLQIRASAMVSLNGRDRTRLIDENADLSRVAWGWKPAKWVIHLQGGKGVQAPSRAE